MGGKGDRGGGVHIKGGLRIRDLSLSFDSDTGAMASSPVTVEVRVDTFEHWLAIADDAAKAAVNGRKVALDAGEDDAQFDRGLEAEFRASLTAIGAAAFAIDAFFASTIHHAPQARTSAASRDASIFETLKRAYSLSPERLKALREPLRVIFRLRDDAVHPSATWVAPAQHPIFNVGMEPRFVNYRVENAGNAHAIAQKLIAICLRSPKAEYPDLVEWCSELQDSVPSLDDPPYPEVAESSS
jgi:cold shock CspA family protein